MALKRTIVGGRKGMQRDKHPGELSSEEYTFMLNGNFQDEHGNGAVILQNEPSNIKCSGFKLGYKVIGHKFDVNKGRTYFFLTNPDTGCSEIGYIESFYKADGLDAIESTCKCNIKVILEDPLEKKEQIAICEYHTIISDYCELTGECTGCLNFSINYPIRESSIQIKTERTGTNLYFTDYLNPQRYLQLDNLDIYTHDTEPCDDEVTSTCLQCDKLRVFPLYDKLCIRARIIQTDGNLRAGMYEILAAYATINGEELSDYYSLTNPVPIFDENNNILDQTNLDYLTNQAISFDINDLDQTYDYYKVAVIYRSGLDGSLTVYEYGIFPTSNDRVVVSNLRNKKIFQSVKGVDPLLSLLSRRVFYNKARGLTAGNDVLYHYGLEAHREINLQRVVNLLGGFVNWSTIQANEDLYKDGADVSNYLGFTRGEVVPLGIKFYEDGGYEYPLFPFISRPPSDYELQELGSEDFPENSNTNSVLEYNPDCTVNNRNKRWQFEDTSTIVGRCEIDSEGYEEEVVTREVEDTCYVSESETGELTVVDEITSSSFQFNSEESIVDYINDHINEIINSTGPNGSDIRSIISNPTSYPESCTPDFGSNCSEEIELVTEEIFAIGVDSEVVTEVDKNFDEYVRPIFPQICNIYQVDGDGNPIEDTSFENSYMDSSETVYKRAASPMNTSCYTATIGSILSNPQIDNINFLANKGQVTGINTLITTLSASETRTTHSLQLLGTSGTANIIVAGINYLATFVTNLTTTAANFVSVHAADILSFDGTVVTSIGAALVFVKQASVSPTLSVSNITGNLNGENDSVQFTDKIHSNGIWIKLSFNGEQRIAFELTNINCATADDNSAKSIRLSAFSDCTDTSDISTYGRIIDDMTLGSDPQKFIVFDSSDFGGTSSNIYVILDSPIRTRIVESAVSPGVFNTINTLTPPCGCFGAYQREVETSRLVSYEGLTFGKKQTYKSLCSFIVPSLKGCDPIPYQYGLFSHWESEIKYPCTKELYDSSTLEIKPEDIPVSIRDSFEDYYTDGITSGTYDLKPDTDFQDKNIRFYKFPDSSKVPFMSFNTNIENQDPGPFNKSVIYPIGFSIDNSVINAFLDIAVSNGLITLEERLKISKYEIFRADRRTNKSVIAKGLLFDVYKYNDVTGDPAYYSNYPLNSLGKDIYNGGVNHPYSSNGNTKFTFHSPETSFFKPTLPRELSIEGYQFGKAAHYFDEVKDHSTYVLLGDRAYSVATTLAVAEVVFEVLLQIADYTLTATSAGTAPGIGLTTAAAIGFGISVAAQGVFKVGEKRYRWLETFINLGKPNNFAYYQVAIGHYSVFLPNELTDDTLRGIPSTSYIKAGRFSVTNEVSSVSLNINNVDREDSVFLSLGEDSNILKYPVSYKSYDNSSANPSNASRRGYTGTGRSHKIVSNAASPYVALKQYSPSQYGSIYSIEWLNTGFCGDLTMRSNCDPIFGGDTYISRFSLKRKLPFFTSNAVGLAPLIPFEYSEYFNVNPINRTSGFFLDYLINDDSNNFVSLFVFPTPKSHFNLDPGNITEDENVFYVKPPAKFYLFSYGIPYFLVESTVNCNFRIAKRELFENFYPNVGDVIDWTQENVPSTSIKNPNTYFYNTVYSTEHSFYPWRMLPINYSEKLYNKLNNLENTVIFSKQDITDNGLTDPWLLYKALDYFNFQKDFGKLVNMRVIESEQILARFTNGFTILGAMDTLKDRLEPESQLLGGSNPLSGRNISFNKTDLGYAGTQHSASVNCEFGTFWVDARRGHVFNLKPNGDGLAKVTTGCEKWFKENLPFKMVGNIEGLTDMDVDNAFRGFGIVMGWDDRLKRVFLTKKDYIVLKSDIKFKTDIGFYVLNDEREIVEIDLEDTQYFKECSFTIAYSPLTETWVSYYSFKPNYYISYGDYFQTGINYSTSAGKIGVWSHFSFLSSNQVFYGELYPWIIEYPLSSQGADSVLQDIQYYMDVRKYYSKHDFANVYGHSFNKGWVYNDGQNSGQLNLIFNEKNSLSQLLDFPHHNSDSVDILNTEIDGKWSFNYLYNMVRDERSGLPLWINDCSQIDKHLNDKLFDYRSIFKDYLRGDYFVVRLQQDIESRFKMIFRFAYDDREFYEQ